MRIRQPPHIVSSIPYNRPAFHVSVSYRVLMIVNLSHTFLLNYHVCISGTEDPVKNRPILLGSTNHSIQPPIILSYKCSIWGSHNSEPISYIPSKLPCVYFWDRGSSENRPINRIRQPPHLDVPYRRPYKCSIQGSYNSESISYIPSKLPCVYFWDRGSGENGQILLGSANHPIQTSHIGVLQGSHIVNLSASKLVCVYF